MEYSCVRQMELPNTTKLFSDFIYHPEKLKAFYRFGGELDFPADRRRDLVSALHEQNGDSESLDLLSQPGTAAVVTGQQVGFCGGPAYTVYKALTAIKKARALRDEGIPAVPVFWVATEDHDFAEVDHAWFFDAEFQPVRFLAQAAPQPGQPVGGVILDGLPLDEMAATLRGLPFSEEAITLVRDAYRPGVTFGQAFASLMDRLFDGYGLLRIDPTSAAVRRLGAPLMREAIRSAKDLTAALLERNQQLNKAGYHAQVHVEEQTSLFFLIENGRRVALRRQNGDYVAGTRRFSSQELSDRAEQLSPNALLRPVVQDYMLPTYAYAGGPAELAYFAQSQVLYERLLGRQPIAMHRASFTILDAHSRKLMDRYRLELKDFFHGDGALRERLARALVPEGLSAKVSRSRETIVKAAQDLTRDLGVFDPGLAKALDKSRRKIEYQIGKIEKKAAREMLERDARALDDARRLYGLVYPDRHLQERIYSIIPLIAQHGPALIEKIYDNVRFDCPDHQILTA